MHEPDPNSTEAAERSDSDARLRVGPPEPLLPVVIEPPPPLRTPRRRWRLTLVAALLLGAAAGLAWLAWRQHLARLPPGIVSGNGRLEADEIDIDTKFAGRIARLFVDEGDLVTAGQVLATMDTRDLQASLERSQAILRQAQHALDEARANLAQQEAQARFATQELDRAQALVQKGVAPIEQLDQRRQQIDAAIAARDAAVERIHQAEHALEAAAHDVELYRVDIEDDMLVAPRDGRIQYRVANVGEVLAAGGKVFTMLDTSYVYMDIYLPTLEAGRVRLGSDARIVLDAYPAHVIPARVVFVASQAQFTPKTVETKDEREKLMFRIRVRIDPDRLRARPEIVRSGLPGVAYVRTEPSAIWPPRLEASAPP